MLELEIPSGSTAYFILLQDLNSALYLLGYQVDMVQVENDLLEKCCFSMVVKNADNVFEEITIRFID